MSSSDEVEYKAGHPPAMKVAGVRHPPRRKSAEERPRRDSDKDVEQIVARSPLKPPTTVAPVLGNLEKEYPVAAVKHTHEQPVPTHTPRNAANVAPIIPQPRK
uniref:Death-associated protein-like protein n=1 Tax=Penaeus monodon TaxID=6687 RepID=S5TQG7_PENMO|nr:death-associated protein-like protein [Penaeus monodon]